MEGLGIREGLVMVEPPARRFERAQASRGKAVYSAQDRHPWKVKANKLEILIYLIKNDLDDMQYWLDGRDESEVDDVWAERKFDMEFELAGLQIQRKLYHDAWKHKVCCK
jgi:hypothetical protein